MDSRKIMLSDSEDEEDNNSPSTFDSDLDTEAPTCYCGVLQPIKIVKGRPFRTCNTCGYFDWCEKQQQDRGTEAATPTAVAIKVEQEADSSQSSSQSSLSLEDLGPRLHEDVLLEIAKHMDVKTLMAARSVNKDWNTACAKEFRKKAILVTNLTFEKHIDKFMDTFNPKSSPKLVVENLWFPELQFLKNKSMKKWVEKYGDQIKSAKLGDAIEDHDIRGGGSKLLTKVFTINSISTFLSNCPNLKSLVIPAPFSITYHGAFRPKNDPQVQLDRLEFGSDENTFSNEYPPTLRGSSSLLLNIMKCLKSLKYLKIVNLDQTNFDGISAPGKQDADGKAVLEKVMELSLKGSDLDPRELITPSMRLKFKNLRKLTLASFCDCDLDEQLFLPDLLSSLKNQLEELIFSQCPTHSELICPKLERCFPQSMVKLEVFKLKRMTQWRRPSMEFLQRLPKLKVLHLLPVGCYHRKSYIDHLFNKRVSKNTVYHDELKELVIQCGSETSKTFTGIGRRFPNLETLEAEFFGSNLKAVISGIKKQGNLKSLKLHVDSRFECDYFNVLGTSGIEKMTLVYQHKDFRQLSLSLNVHFSKSFYQSTSLRELNFIGMEFERKEYELLTAVLSKVNPKINLRLFECRLKDAATAQ